MKKKRKITRKELENKVFVFLFSKDPEMCKEFFDLTDRQLYDRCRYLGISWKNTGKVQ